jgi:hypothetical protein
MSTGKLTDRLIPIFDKAVGWYSAHKGAQLRSPGCMINPNSVLDIDPDSDDAFGLFYTKSDCLSRLSSAGTLINISTHMIPLFAGIHQGYSTGKLAEIITHHNITVDDFENISLGRQGENKIFDDWSGKAVNFGAAYIEAWKAFHELGLLTQGLYAPTTSNFAAIYTECSPAWPDTIVREIAEGSLNDDGDHLPESTCVLGEINFLQVASLPNDSACDFLRRSGMLASAVHRKQVAFHHAWEDLCMAEDEPKGHMALRILLSCKDLSEDEKPFARNALRLMHPDRGGTQLSMTRVFSRLTTWLAGSDIDVSNSIILKINLSGATHNDAKSQKELMARRPDVYEDILQAPQHVLGRVCQEILSLRPDQMGYADLAVFRSLKQLELGTQVIEGFRPEDVILKLETGMKDFMGGRTKTNLLTQRMYDGMSDAFKLFGEHKWDYAAFKGCPEQTVLTLVRGGAAMGKLPDMGRQRRGHFLEEELGM